MQEGFSWVHCFGIAKTLGWTHWGGHYSWRNYPAAGKVKRMLAPPSGEFFAVMVPWCDSMIRLQIDNPRPLPWLEWLLRGCVVKKRSNTRSRFSVLIPLPESRTSVTRTSSCCCVDIYRALIWCEAKGIFQKICNHLFNAEGATRA